MRKIAFQMLSFISWKLIFYKASFDFDNQNDITTLHLNEFFFSNEKQILKIKDPTSRGCDSYNTFLIAHCTTEDAESKIYKPRHNHHCLIIDIWCWMVHLCLLELCRPERGKEGCQWLWLWTNLYKAPTIVQPTINHALKQSTKCSMEEVIWRRNNIMIIIFCFYPNIVCFLVQV